MLKIDMGFQRARTEKQVADRQDEIISACDEIYRKKGYEAVHIKAISGLTSISRPGIYNYYKTRDDILLDVLKRDYIKWEEELLAHYRKIKKMTREAYCSFMAHSLKKHEKYLELVTIYIHPIERNSSLEKLSSFKMEIHRFFQIILEGLAQYFPRTSKKQRRSILFYLMVIITGAYSHTHLTEKQIQAIKNADPDDTTPDFHRVCYDALMMLMRDI